MRKTFISLSILALFFLMVVAFTGCPKLPEVNDATLEALELNGIEVPNFDPEIFEYFIELPAGTTEVPTVTVLPSVEGVQIEIIEPETLPGTITIIVTALDGQTQRTYYVYLTLKKSNDSGLDSIHYDGISVPGFNTDTFEYEIVLPVNYTGLPLVEAETRDENASAEVSQVSSLPGTATILVTAEDGESTSTYLIHFIPTYRIAASSTPIEGGSVSGGGDYEHGEVVTLIATANEGFIFVNWTENGTLVSAEPEYSFQATENRTLVANFAAEVLTVELSANPEAGGVVEGAGNYPYGQTVEISATVNEGYEFVNWTESEEVVSNDSEYTFVVTESRSLVANFSIISYSVVLSAKPIEGGVVQGAGNYEHGKVVNVSAAPNEGYTFEGWYEDGEKISSKLNYSFEITSDITLEAVFKIKVYFVTAAVNPLNGGTVVGNGIYKHGDTATLVADEADGFRFLNWTENGKVLSTNKTISFEVSGNRSLVANFERMGYQISVSANPVLGGVVDGGGIYDLNEEVTVSATPNETYRFLNWSENGVQVSDQEVYTFNANENRDLVANFEQITYTINASAGQGGSIDPSGDVVVVEGNDQEFTITPDVGYEIDDVAVDGVSVGAIATYKFEDVTANHTIEVSFKLKTYTITVTPEPAAGGEAGGGGLFNHGDQVTVIATPSEGYAFISWTEDGVEQSTEKTYIFTAEDDRNLDANFKTTHTITATSGDNGSISPSGDVVVIDGNDKEFTMTPDEGYEVEDVLVDGVSVGAVTSYKFENVTADHTIHVTFNLKTYTVTVTASPVLGGAVDGGGVFTHGEEVTAVATPNEGYEFVNWSENGNILSNQSIYVFTATSDRDLVAGFRLKTHTIVASAGDGGSIGPAGNVPVTHGTDKEFTMTPDEGYEVEDVLVDGVSVGAVTSYKFENVTADHTIHVTFKLKTYIIVASSGSNGAIAPAGNVPATHGTDKEFTMTPDEGYEVEDVLVDSVSVGAVTSYKFENVSANHTIHVTFKLKMYTITVTASPSDGGTVGGGGAYNHGDEVTVAATPSEGKKFFNWTENGAEVSSEKKFTFTANNNRNLVANFGVNRVPEFDKLLPANGAVNQPLDVKLEWNAVDPDGDAVTYDVYFGYSADSLSKVLEGTNLKEYSPGVIKGFSFYWKVVASDGSGVKDSGVMIFTTVSEVLTDKSIHIIDNFLDKQPSEPVAMVVQVKGIGTISGSEVEIEINTDYIEFVNFEGQTLAEYLAANPEATYEDFVPECEYKATMTNFLKIIKLKDATGTIVSLNGVYTNATGRSIADGNLWFIYVKTKDQTGKTIADFSKVSFKDASLNEITVDSSDQGLFIVK